MRDRRIAVDAAIALLLFGCIPVVIRSITADIWTIGISRLLVAAFVTLPFAWRAGALAGLRRHDVLWLALIGLLFFGHWATYFQSIRISSASTAAIGLSTYGIHLLLLTILVKGERARRSDMLAVIIAAAGAVMVVPEWDARTAGTAGLLLACASAFVYATLPLLHQRLSSIPTLARVAGQFGFALLLFLCFLPRSSWSLDGGDWVGLAFLALGPTLVGHSLWVRVTTKLPALTTSVIYYGNIPVAIALGVIVLDEPLPLRTMLGAAMIIGGGAAGLYLRQRREPE